METVLTSLIAARPRKLIFRNLPLNASISTVAGLVFGAKIEEIVYKPKSAFAIVLLLDANECLKLYKATGNGIEWPDKKRNIWVEIGQEVNPLTGKEQNMIEKEWTRVIRAYGVDADLNVAALRKLGNGVDNDLALEHVEIGVKPDTKVCVPYTPSLDTLLTTWSNMQ